MIALPFEFPVKPRTGSELRRIFYYFNPFESDGKLKPEGELLTLLASNSNYPNTLETSAFAQASAEGQGSPQIVQYSYTSLAMEGIDKNKLKLKERFSGIRPCGLGAALANIILTAQATTHNADMLFMALDHFTSPDIDKVDLSGAFAEEIERKEDYAIARGRIENAERELSSILGNEAKLKDEELNRHIGYMLSPEYNSFRKDFLAAVRFGNPAWAMIDTGGLPLILNFATSRDLVSAVRNELDNYDVMLELERSTTGKSGDEEKYAYWLEDMAEEKREREKTVTLKFAEYTGADAIAYNIGLKHEAKLGETRRPDKPKLTEIQFALSTMNGRHIPFALHGGTSSSEILRGLVGKHNVNTQYLYKGTESELDRCKRLEPQIRGRDKKACGTDRFLEEVTAVKCACVDYLKATGSYGLSPRFREILDSRDSETPAYQASQVRELIAKE